eukprot:TRINITY_DN10875_c0_g1_i1.p1 TRINITY_DN10875_c0_g1~~TRINITY_DN10875_c0_g1_i1.p1  ORF type:complete len:163 (+),score=24.15 TRINITY_DN10875_c0_g1_i1:112-600(+)
MQNEQDILKKREEKLVESIDDIKNNVENLENETSRIQQEYKENENELDNVRQKRDKMEREKASINEKLSVLFEELKEMEIGIRDSAKEKEEYEVLQTLQKLFSGIYGRLSNLIDVRQARFKLAVAVGLGVNNDAVIVENKQIAMQCMDHMRKREGDISDSYL